MTYAQLLEVAQRKGFVKWEFSKIVEQLRVCQHLNNRSPSNRRVEILAANVYTRREHPIWKRDCYYCEEVVWATVMR